MRLPLAPGALALLALACSTPTAPATPRMAASATTSAVDGEWVDGKTEGSAGAEATAAEADPASGSDKAPDYRTYRLGFWEFDLMALDVEPRGTTFRLLDFRIFKLLEVGSGPDYHSFGLVEIPPLLSVFSTRHEEDTGEFKLVDVQAFALALVRHTRESETEFQTHFLKLPVLGSFFAREREDTIEKQHFLYIIRREVED